MCCVQLGERESYGNESRTETPDPMNFLPLGDHDSFHGVILDYAEVNDRPFVCLFVSGKQQ